MMQPERKDFLFNQAFVGSLIVLALNDHILKAAFSNGITGKLSDFAGMVILPLLLVFIFPKLKVWAIPLSMLVFIFWKSSVSQSFINIVNSFEIIAIGRVVDYTDFFVFAILPLPYLIIKQNKKFDFIKLHATLSPIFLLIPCVFLLMATSMSPKYMARLYSPATGNINLKNTHFTVHLSHADILKKLEKEGLYYYKDATPVHSDYGDEFSSQDNYPIYYSRYESYYKIDKIIIGNDTIREIQFYLQFEKPSKTKVYLNSIKIDKNLSEEKAKEKLTTYYKKLLKKYFKEIY